MDYKEKISKFIWSFLPNYDFEGTAWIEFTDENTEKLQKYKDEGYTFEDDACIYKDGEYIEDGLEGIIHLAEKEFGVNIEFTCVGDYTSCGYDMFCYAWACIIDGELYFDSATKESF